MRGTTNLWRSGRLGRCARGDAALAPVAESGERMSQPTVGIVGNRNLARPLSGEAPSFRRGRTVTSVGPHAGRRVRNVVTQVEDLDPRSNERPGRVALWKS